MDKPTAKVTVIRQPVHSKEEKREQVVIPFENTLGQRFPSIKINYDEFHAGGIYECDESYARVVKDRIKAHNEYALRLMRPRVQEHVHPDEIGQ